MMTASQNVDQGHKPGGANALLLLLLFFGTMLLLPLGLVNALPPNQTREITVYRDAPLVECNPGWFGDNKCTEGEQTVSHTVTRSPEEYNSAVLNRYLWYVVLCLPVAIGAVFLVNRFFEPTRAQ